MYTGSHCVALDHNFVRLWFLSLHCSFLLRIGRYAGGHVGELCVVVCITFSFGVSYGCGLCLFTGPPSTLDNVLSHLFSFI